MVLDSNYVIFIVVLLLIMAHNGKLSSSVVEVVFRCGVLFGITFRMNGGDHERQGYPVDQEVQTG